MAFTPFFQGTDAQNLITNYLNKNITADTSMEAQDINANNVFRNPYSPEGFYANETDVHPVEAYKPPVEGEDGVPSCEEGYVYDTTLNTCRFVGYPKRTEEQSGRTEDDPKERPYMSIEDMENASDEDFLDYLTSGFLKNSALGYLPSKGTEVTLGMGTLPPLFQLAFGGQNQLRKDFILSGLMKRGYFTGKFDDNKNPIFDIGVKNVNTNVGGIESMLPQNVQGQPVTDVFGDTYQQVFNQDGNTGYTFTSGNPQDSVGQTTQSGVVYGTGRGSGGKSSGSGVVVNTTGSGSPHLNTGTPVSYASLNPNDGILYTAPSNSPHGNIGQQVKKFREKTGYNSNPNNLLYGK